MCNIYTKSYSFLYVVVTVYQLFSSKPIYLCNTHTHIYMCIHTQIYLCVRNLVTSFTSAGDW